MYVYMTEYLTAIELIILVYTLPEFGTLTAAMLVQAYHDSKCCAYQQAAMAPHIHAALNSNSRN